MIRSFADRGTEEIFDGSETRAARATCPKRLWSTARRKLDQLNRVRDLLELAIPLWAIGLNGSDAIAPVNTAFVSTTSIVFAFAGRKVMQTKSRSRITTEGGRHGAASDSSR